MRRSTSEARAILHRRIAVAKVLGIHGRRRRIVRQAPPKAIEIAYTKLIKERVLSRAWTLVKDRVLPRLEAWERSARTWRGDSDEGDEVNEALDEAATTLFDEWPNERLRALVRPIGDRVSDYQRQQWIAQVRAGIGIDPLLNEPWLRPRLAQFAAQNAALIKDAAGSFLSDVEKRVLAGLSAGTRPETIAAELQDRLGIAEDRATLIGRDQTNKLFGDLNKTRQEEAGVSRFVWRTVQDERTRHSHAELDGETFDWDDPPEVDGETAYPGFPINCRCVADPVLDDVDSGD